jgi:hypothetical protein
MRRLSLIGGALAIVLVGLVPACGGDPATKNPVGPSAPSAGGLQITGPGSIAPGQSAQFIAETRLSDGTVKLLAAQWRSSNTSVLQVTSSGLATAGQNSGDATVTADLPPRRSTKEVIVVPDGTYRLVGSVREADAPLPIAGARVEVSGTSLAATTDFGGQYRLYGVPAAAEIRVTANGYLPVAQTIQLTAHGTQNFQLSLSAPRISLNGPFTVTIDAAGTCAGNPELPSNLQRRTYEASVTTTGSFVDVRLTEPRFRVSFGQGNQFTGRADPASVTFNLFALYAYAYYYYPSVAERLPDNTILVPFGTATTSRTNGGVSGTMNGGMNNYDSRFPAFNSAILGRCSSNGIRFTLTPR